MIISKESLKPGQMYYEKYAIGDKTKEAYYIILSLFDKNEESYISWYDVDKMIVREEQISSFSNATSESDIIPIHLVATLED